MVGGQTPGSREEDHQLPSRRDAGVLESSALHTRFEREETHVDILECDARDVHRTGCLDLASRVLNLLSDLAVGGSFNRVLGVRVGSRSAAARGHAEFRGHSTELAFGVGTRDGWDLQLAGEFWGRSTESSATA